VLGIHQIRPVPDLLPYDVTWNVVAAVLLVVGAALTVRTRRRTVAPA
jgi:uncharacterized membrane protein